MRRLVAVISAIVFLDAMLFGALIPLVPAYVDDFDLSKLQAGMLVGAFGAGAVLGGIPGGIVAGRVGPKNAVISGLLLLALATFGLALADSPETVGIARFLQGLSSALTWAGALSWVTVSTPRALRGQLLGTVFGIAVLGAILGPMVGAVAKLVGLRAGFAGIGVIALLLAVAAFLQPRPGVEVVERGAVRRAFADPAFVAGLWLNALPALFFGVLDVLAPLALDAGGYGAIAIGAVFLVAGLIETALNPLLGRLSDRRGRLLPDPLGALRLDRRRDPARRRRLPGCDRRARDRGGAVVRRLLHAGNRARLRPRRDGRPCAGVGVRNHEHRLGRRARWSGRRSAAGSRTCSAMPRRTSSARSSARSRSRRSPCACDRAHRQPDEERSVRPPGGELLERPGGVERAPAVVLAADERVVPGARVHRQPRLGRVEPVVGVDQVVHLVERPRLDGSRPRSRKCVVVETGGEQLLPGRSRAGARALPSARRSSAAEPCTAAGRRARRGSRRPRDGSCGAAAAAAGP